MKPPYWRRSPLDPAALRLAETNLYTYAETKQVLDLLGGDEQIAQLVLQLATASAVSPIDIARTAPKVLRPLDRWVHECGGYTWHGSDGTIRIVKTSAMGHSFTFEVMPEGFEP